MLGMDDPPAVTEHPWWVSAARAHLETTPVEPAPVLAPAIITWRDLVPAIPARPITHRVAVCRWCGGRFYRAHERPPQWLCLSAACAERQIAASIRRTVPEILEGTPDAGSPWLFLPLPLNVDLIESPYKRTLMAGAAGSSKSYGARWLAYRECLNRPGIRVLLLRCTFDELFKNHGQYMAAEAAQLSTFGHGSVKYLGSYYKSCNFENGSVILTGHCQYDADIAKHLGQEVDLIVIEEAVNFLPRALQEIPSRDRGSPTARAHGETDGKTWLLSNPGGQGMLTLSDFYITRTPDPKEFPHYNADVHGYIRATLEDNPYLPEDYAAKNLSGLSAARYRQLRHGDWTVFTGQFFEFDQALHVRAVELPA